MNEKFVSANIAEETSRFNEKVEKGLSVPEKLNKRKINNLIEDGMRIIEKEDESLCTMDNMAINFILQIVEFLIKIRDSLK